LNKRTFTLRAGILAVATADYKPEHVAVDEAVIAQLSPPEGGFSLMKTNLPGTPAGSSLQSAIAYLLTLNALNYRFWSLRDGKVDRYAFEGAVGALGMRKAFDAAWGANPDPSQLALKLRTQSIESMFGDIPDPTSRRLMLEDLLVATTDKPSVMDYAHRLAAWIKEEKRVTTEMAGDIAYSFYVAYADDYLKRAQLALAEIAGYCAEIGEPVESSDLTVFTDYQVPRVMRALGILKYSPALIAKVDGLQLIDRASDEENAIRAATLLAGEAMAQAFKVTPAQIDNVLWLQRNKAGSAPFHLTVTTDY
jgi:hypothetical protein